MYQKTRFRLTVLFSSVTCTLLLIFLLVAAYLSFDSQYSMQLAGFSRQAASVSDEISNQNVLTNDWLNTKENSGSLYLYMFDQNTPLFHNSTHPEEIQEMITSLFSAINFPSDSSSIITSLSSVLKKASGEYDIFLKRDYLLPEYFIYADVLIRDNSILHIFAVQPLDALCSSWMYALLKYLLLFLFAGSILILFSWYFTGKLLKPMEDARISQNRFISDASHELRTPLAVIMANASACRRLPTEEQEVYFDIIEREGTQMSVLLDQLLTLSRADSHAFRLQTESADLQTLLLEVYETFHPLAVKHDHILTVRFPENDLPVCHCDTFRIKQLLGILIQNALSYTPHGCRISLSVQCDIAWLILSVSDNGPGITDSEKTKIFERFYRSEISHTAKGHYGLGLPVAKEIALAHNGILEVKDSENGGAEFILKLPR